MKRRSLLVGSALAGVGAILGVARVGEAVLQGDGQAPTIPMLPVAQSERDHDEMVLAAMREQPWYQELLKQRVMEQLYPMYSMNLMSRSQAAEAMGMSGYEVQQLLDPPDYHLTPTDRIIHSLAVTPTRPQPYPYMLKLPDSGPGG